MIKRITAFLIVPLLIVNLIFVYRPVKVSAVVPFALLPIIGSEALAWSSIAGASGVSLNYTAADFKDYGSVDAYGNFKFTDLAGAQLKIANDYKTLGTATKESTENLISQFAANQQAFADGKMTNEEWEAFNTQMNVGLQIQQTVADWITSNDSIMSDSELSRLQLNCAQLQLFSAFLKTNADYIKSGNITVQNGVKGTLEQISAIHIPYGVQMWYTPVNSRFVSYSLLLSERVSPSLGKYSYMQLVYSNLLTRQIFYLDGSGILCESSGGAFKLNYYTVGRSQLIGDDFSGWFNQYDSHDGSLISSDYRYDYCYLGSSELPVDMRINLYMTSEAILSTTIPTVIDNAISIPTTSVPVKTAVKDVTTTFPLDWTDDTVISVPVPDVDTMVGELTDTASIPIAIPDEIVQDVPNLLMPGGITQKFPFCLPFDFVNGLKLFVAPAVPPKISQYVGTTFMGREFGGTLTIDFAPFGVVAKLSRILSTIGFIWFLAFSTKKLMGGGQ